MLFEAIYLVLLERPIRVFTHVTCFAHRAAAPTAPGTPPTCDAQHEPMSKFLTGVFTWVPYMRS